MAGRAVPGSMAARTRHFADQLQMLHGHLPWAGLVTTTDSRVYVAWPMISKRFVQQLGGNFTTSLRRTVAGARLRMTQAAIDRLVRAVHLACVDIPKGPRTATICLRAFACLGIVLIQTEFVRSW